MRGCFTTYKTCFGVKERERSELGLTAQMTNTPSILEVDAPSDVVECLLPDGPAVVCVCRPASVFRVSSAPGLGYPPLRSQMIGTALRAGCEPGISRGGVLVGEVPSSFVVLCFLDSRMMPRYLDICWIARCSRIRIILSICTTLAGSRSRSSYTPEATSLASECGACRGRAYGSVYQPSIIPCSRLFYEMAYVTGIQ